MTSNNFSIFLTPSSPTTRKNVQKYTNNNYNWNLFLPFFKCHTFSNHKFLFQSTLEVLDLDFVKLTCASTQVNAKSRNSEFMMRFWVLFRIEETFILKSNIHTIHQLCHALMSQFVKKYDIIYISVRCVLAFNYK